MVSASEVSTFSPASVASTRAAVSDEVKPDPSVGREKLRLVQGTITSFAPLHV